MTRFNNTSQALNFSDLLHTRIILRFIMGVFPILTFKLHGCHKKSYILSWQQKQNVFTDMKGGCCKNLSGIPLFLHSCLKLRYLTNIQCSSFSAWMWRLQYFSFLNPVPLLLAKICLRCSLTQMHNH